MPKAPNSAPLPHPTHAPSARDVKESYARGMAALQAGKLAEALEIFGAIHEANPRIAEVEFQIGRLFTAQDRTARALPHAAAAATLAPDQPVVWLSFAEAVALDGGAEPRKEFLRLVNGSRLSVAQKAALADRFGAGSKGTLPAGGAAVKQTLSRITALFNGGHFAEAEADAARLIAAQPDCAMAHSLRGSALAALGKPTEARKSWYSAVARAPDLVQALGALGLAALRDGTPAQAVRWLDRALPLAPDRVEVQRARGNALTALRQYEPAYEAFVDVAKLTKRKQALPLMMLAQAAAHLGRDEEAEAAYREALALEPANAQLLVAYGLFLQGLGRFAEAEVQILAAITAAPEIGESYRLYYASHKATPGEPMLAEMERRFADPATSEADRRAFGFAIAKALEDIKDYGRVFDHLDPANALMRKAKPYDITERERQVDALMQALDGMDWSQKIEGASDAAPIFVTGMPRSGTTLIEQIIASHSRVTGGGELADNTVSAMRLMPVAGGKIRPASLIPATDFVSLGQDYAAMMQARFPETPQITDKSIQTYLTMGLMKLAMPNAKFIVVRRDPRDTLLSIYKNVFPEGTHLYGYDQVDLARHYATFVRMIDFWRERVPGWFHEVQYEALVDDPEVQSRALIAACGLDWEEACLNFHANKRKVETLSVFQVRQPISKGSVKAWERYGDRLAPMIDRLRADGMIED
ncbi:sulfotransferase [Xinfangfangia sp. CPCC 101601]|uniref:Sulfotransferase n=1 Tax=Pseudogemmobacter lacusdianii TaxID=3069608 RepID=A0ABU0VX61_9RHOB|nr:sulfotransferase [Xinfangfangia sp. CPCC 101601]MDQ2066350.1 sulfotransferase [Xinfangfangia sp. CPCC 101601]